MSENLENKKGVITEIQAKLEKAASIVLVDYRGLNADQVTELRSHLRKENIEYKIYKNTLVKRAMEDAKYAEVKEVLEGPTALAFSYEDSTLAARKLNDLVKKFEALEFKAGMIDGTFYNAKDIQAIGEIPSRDELLSRLLGSMKSPITNFARVIKQVAEKSA